MKSLQDFSLIRSHVQKYLDHDQVSTLSLAFYYFVCDTILGLNESEIDENITDNYYLKKQGDGRQGHDQGIDIFYIDSTATPPTVHLFNCKYTEVFEKTESHFPGNEIDKIAVFLQQLMGQDIDAKKHVNPVLYSKMEEVWEIFDKSTPNFVLHFCSNYYNGFESTENVRLEKIIKGYSRIRIEQHTIQNFVEHLVKKESKQVNAKVKAIDKNFFLKADGDVRALIVDIDVRDLLRIVSSDEEFRDNPSVPDYEKLKTSPILEYAFEDNVRLYLDQKSKINQTIKQTAMSENCTRVFYYNNGITITCSKFEYPTGVRAPIIDMTGLQVVNGSQTIHSLFEAYKESAESFEDMDILVRIYETSNDVLSKDISEYTNSQNPVKSRDVRSNDYFQKKLESELKVLGYNYERKKNQYREIESGVRLDSEMVGQALFAFNNGEPGSAKDKKKEIFGDFYETVFNDDVTADLCLLSYFLLMWTETKRREFRKELLNDYSAHKDYEFILHATMYFLYLYKTIGLKRGVEVKFSEFDKFKCLYTEIKELILAAVKKEIELKGEINLRVFFKGNRAKTIIESL